MQKLYDPLQFRQIISDPYSLQLGDKLSMENSFTGYLEAVYLGTEWKHILTDEPVLGFIWVKQDWSWLGQHPDNLPTEGSSGSLYGKT